MSVLKSSPISSSYAVVSAGLALGALALSVIAAGSALAQTPAQAPMTVSVTVPVGDLPPGRTGDETLAERISDAARKACGEVVVRSPLDPRAVKTCEAGAITSALRGPDRAATLASR
jgi:UrcA family protein